MKLFIYAIAIALALGLTGCKEGETAKAEQLPVYDNSNWIAGWDTMLPDNSGSSNFCRVAPDGLSVICDLASAPSPACDGMTDVGGFMIFSETDGIFYNDHESISFNGRNVTAETSQVTLGLYDVLDIPGSIVVELQDGCFRQYFRYDLP